METKINIAEILKDKPQETKLYDLLRNIEVELDSISHTDYENIIWCRYNDVNPYDLYGYSTFGTERGWLNGLQILLPSKEMRDWFKFTWKKGDVLVSMEGSKILFDKWANEDYTKFLGKIKLLGDSHCYDTANYSLALKEEALEFIKSVEEINNGKLNLETLEIEKSEFKDGDIVCISGMGYLAYGIVKSIDNSSKKLEYYVLNDMSTLKFEDWLSFEDKQIQPITETQQIILFDALARENKAWDAEKIQIVDLKPKVKLKPFDKVIVRCSKADKWSIDFFSYKVSNGYICTGDAWFGYCLPYNEETAKLVGTTNNVEDQV